MVLKQTEDLAQKIRAMKAELEQLRDIANNEGYHECVACSEWVSEQLMVNDAEGDWRCDGCHDEHQAETGGGDGCPGCEGGVPANCVCGRNN